MSQEGVAALVDRWMEDEAFREALRTDAAAAIGAGPFDLTAEERDALAAQDWTLSDEELKQRVSRAAICCHCGC
jgi:hypothetical protein